MSRRCRKVCYPDAATADAARRELQHADMVDPGLEIYGCRQHGEADCNGGRGRVWHLGHAKKGRSLAFREQRKAA